MTLANKITLTRIALIPVLVILMTIGGQGCMIAALVLFILTSVTDFLDGYVARKYNQVTDFGKFVDPLADKLLVTAALCLFVEQGLIAGGLVWIILAREFIISGLRLVAAGNGRVIAAGKLGKLKTVFQMSATIALMLLVPVTGKALLGRFGVVLANVLMYIATVLTIVSGAEYILNNRDCIRE